MQIIMPLLTTTFASSSMATHTEMHPARRAAKDGGVNPSPCCFLPGRSKAHTVSHAQGLGQTDGLESDLVGSHLAQGLHGSAEAGFS